MSSTAEVAEHPGAAPDSGLRAYLSVAKTPGMPAWTAVVVCQRLPVAMSPLALVYLGKVAADSYSVGAVLAGANALAEAATAGVMGRRFDRNSPREEVQLVLMLQALMLLTLAIPTLFDSGTLPIWAMLVLAAGSGGVASGAHGGLRALLVRTVDRSAHHAALSLESTLTTLVWAVGPGIVGLVVLFADQAWPLLVCGALALGGVFAAEALSETNPAEEVDTTRVRVLRLSWPAPFQEAAVLICVGAAYTGLPTLLDKLGTDAGVAGPVLAAFAVAGILGGLVYGSRNWPGAYRHQSTVLVLAIVAVVGLAVVMPTVVLVIGLMIVSGLVGTPALAARAAGLQELLPERAWATGFSGLYAAGGVGFGAAGLIVAALLGPAGIRTALLACIALAGAAAIVGAIGEARLTARLPLPPNE
jgi:MFS family permease